MAAVNPLDAVQSGELSPFVAVTCVVDDDASFAELKALLLKEACRCTRVGPDTDWPRSLLRQHADLVIIDAGHGAPMQERMLSWLAGRSGDGCPVIMLSACPTPERMVRALDAGAEDFIARPFDALELRARVRAALRRHRRRSSDECMLSVAGFELDRHKACLLDRGAAVDLTSREFAMAWIFFSNLNAFLSRQVISVAVWGEHADVTRRTMEQHVYKLRKKLRLSVERGVVIRTAYGQGYRLELLLAQAVQAAAMDDDESRLFA